MNPHQYSREALSKLFPTLKRTRIEGHFFRLVPLIHAEAIEETGPSFNYGGRYNPAGEFGGLYLGNSPDLCWREILRPYLGREEFVPDQALGEFEIQIEMCLDLTDEQNLKSMGITMQDISDPFDRFITQMIGQTAWSQGIEAIKFPSSVEPGQFNVVVFRDHLSSDSRVKRIEVSPYKRKRG